MATIKELEPVKKFAKMATSPEPRFKTAEGYDREIKKLTGIRDSLFGLEASVKPDLDKSIAVLEAERRIDLRIDLPYKCLSLEPLTWVKNGRPVFAVYALDNGTMKIVRRFAHTASITPLLPEPIAKIYRNAIHANEIGSYSTKTITSTFRGLIPADVRAKVIEARPLFEAKATLPMVFLIAEAAWSETVVTQRPDPLIVGWDGNRLRLIAHFNLTSLERYIKDEFPG